MERALGHLRPLERAEVDPSNPDRLTDAVLHGASPGLIAAIVDCRGVREVAAAGASEVGRSQPLLTTDSVHIGSNTKAMTSTMLAALVDDGVFANGWNTNIAEVFPELRDDVLSDYHSVTLWQLVTMTGGIACDAVNWHAHRDVRLIQRRYRILRDNLAEPPAAAVGKFHYSNLGYVVAGAMAERVTGRTWESLMQERL
jgi:CubicO group peptidase (beta-lactamase class C family)